MNVFEEKMRQMLAEGRLSPEQYRELHAVLCSERMVPPASVMPPPSGSPTTAAAPTAGLPGSVLACAVFLFIAAASQMQTLSNYGTRSGNAFPLALVVISEVGLGIGLLRMQRWAYLIQFPFALLAPLASLFQANTVGFLFNAAYLVLMLQAWPAFYPRRSIAEVWRQIQEKYRKSQPDDSGPLPVPVLALAILMAIMAFLNVTGPFMARSLGNFFAQYAGLNQLTSLHVNILRFIYHHYFSLTPLQGMMAGAVSAALAYGTYRRNRLAFIALTVVTVIGLFSRTPGGGIVLLYVLRVILIIKSWRFFFPTEGALSPESAPSDQL